MKADGWGRCGEPWLGDCHFLPNPSLGLPPPPLDLPLPYQPSFWGNPGRQSLMKPIWQFLISAATGSAGSSAGPLAPRGGLAGVQRKQHASWKHGEQLVQDGTHEPSFGGNFGKAKAHRVSIARAPFEQKVASISMTSNCIHRLPNLWGTKNNSKACCSRSEIGWGGALEEKAKDHVAIRPASPAVACGQRLPRGHSAQWSALSLEPGTAQCLHPPAWELATSLSRERAAWGGKDTQACWRTAAGLYQFTRTHRAHLFPTPQLACW